jgi:hypothetical protein
MEEEEKQRQRMKNFALCEIPLTDEEMQRPPPKWRLIPLTLLVLGAIAFAVFMLR